MRRDAVVADADQRNPVEQTETREYQLPKLPSGKEVEINVRVVGPKRAVITLKNTSKSPVYLTYLPGEPNGFANFMIYTLEKQDESTDEWKQFPSGDFGTGVHPLDQGKRVKARVQTPAGGMFRLTITYLIDLHIFRKLDEISKLKVDQRLAEYEKHEDEIMASQVKITSKPFRIYD